MRKVIITLCYNRPEVCLESFHRLCETQYLQHYEYYWIDPGFPLGNRANNSARLAEMAFQNKIEIIKPYRNRGVSDNWQWAVKELELKTGDVIIGMDPDSEPQQSGWCDAVTDVLSNGTKKIAYCGLTRITPPQLKTEVDESNYSYTLENINGRKCRFYSRPVSWPMGGFSVEFILEKGLHQPRTRYGFIEMGTIRLMENTPWDWCLLDEFHDATSDRGDELYKTWKVDQASQRTTLDFEDYLKGVE